MPETTLDRRTFNRKVLARAIEAFGVEVTDALWAPAKEIVPRTTATKEAAVTLLQASERFQAVVASERASGNVLVAYVRKYDGETVMLPPAKAAFYASRRKDDAPKSAPKAAPNKASKKATPAPVAQAPDVEQALVNLMAAMHAQAEEIKRLAAVIAQK